MKAIRLDICLMFIVINTALAQTTVTTSGGTTGTVPKFTSPSTIGDSVISESNGNVGIGTTNPITTLAVQGTNAAAFVFGYGINGGSFTPTIGTFASRGTPTSPSPVLAGDRLASFFNYSQYDTTPGGTHGISGASIDFFADEDYAPNRNGADMRFLTAANGSGAFRLERMRIDNTGNVGIGTTTAGQRLEVNGSIKLSAGSGGTLIFADGTSQSTAQLVGPPGPQGPIGATGPQGPPGPISGVTAGSGLTGGGTNGNVTLAVNSSVARTNVSQTFTGTQTIFGNLLLGITNNAGGGFSANGGVTFSNNFGGVIITGVCVNIGVCMDLNQSGQIHTSGGFFVGGGDYAESVDVSGDRKAYQPGDVLVIDATGKRKFMRSGGSYSTSVAGIYSTKPGIVGSRSPMDEQRLQEEVPVAMLGIVPCKVTAENGEIEPGDLLVTAATPGHAMKGTDKSRMLGAIIGKALEPLKAGTGIIEVMVMLQ